MKALTGVSRLRSGRMTKWKGRVASLAPWMSGVVLCVTAAPAFAWCNLNGTTWECTGYTTNQWVATNVSGYYLSNGITIWSGTVDIHILEGATIGNTNGSGGSDAISNNSGQVISSLNIVNDGTVKAVAVSGGNFGADLALNGNLGPTTIVNNGSWTGVEAGLTVRSTGQITITNNAAGIFAGSVVGVGMNSATAAVLTNWGDIHSTMPDATTPFYSRAIEGDSEVDTIYQKGGSITGRVLLAGGDDAFYMQGGTLTGNLYMGDGDDVVEFTDGLINGQIDMGAGSDRVLIASTADLTGVTLIDGGDDVATTDGFLDTLNFDGGTRTVDGAILTNWEQIALTEGADLTLDGTGVEVGSGSGPGGEALGVLLDAGTRLGIAQSAFTITGDLVNAGQVDLGNGTAGEVLTVSAGYSGLGGTLLLDTVLGNDSSATDILVIDGATSGTTTLLVTNVGGAGDKTATGILVIKTADFTGGFVLDGGSVSAGNYTYTLQQGVEGWYLVSELDVPTGVYEALPSALFQKLPTLEQRVGQRQWLGRDSSRVGKLEPARGAWMRVWGDKQDIRPETSTSGVSADRKDWGLQLGYDHPLEPGDKGQWVLGVTGQYGNSSTDVVLSEGFGTIKTDGLSLGATATWYGDNGFYTDLQGQVSRLKADIEGNGDTQMLDGRSFTVYGLSAEMGWRKALDGNSAVVPQAQLSWSHINGGRFTDDQGISVDLGSANQLIGRLGLAYEYEYSEGWLFGDRAGSSETRHREKAYLIGNLLHNFSGDTTVTVDGVDLTQSDSRTWAEIGVGGSTVWDGNKTIYTEVAYRRALGGDKAEGLSVTAGFRIQF